MSTTELMRPGHAYTQDQTGTSIRNETTRTRRTFNWPKKASRQEHIKSSLSTINGFDDAPNDSPAARLPTSQGLVTALPGRRKTPESVQDKSRSRRGIFRRRNSLSELSLKSGSSGDQSQLSNATTAYSRGADNYEVGRNASLEFVGAGENLKSPAARKALPPLRSGVPDDNEVDLKNGDGTPGPSLNTDSDSINKMHVPTVAIIDEKFNRYRHELGLDVQKHAAGAEGLERAYWMTARLEAASIFAPYLLRGTTAAAASIGLEPPIIPATARISLFGDALFTKMAGTGDIELNAPEVPLKDDAPRVFRFPVALSAGSEHSAMIPRHSTMFSEEPILQTPGAIDVENPSNSPACEIPPVPPMKQPSSLEAGSRAMLGPKPFSTPPLSCEGLVDRTRLSPYPARGQSLTTQSSRSSLSVASESRQEVPGSSDCAERSPNVESNESWLADSRESSPLPLAWSNAVRSSTFAESSWEDDIDLMYQQEAESTCDFDWDIYRRSRTNATMGALGTGLSTPLQSNRTSSIYSDGLVMAINDSARSSRVTSQELETSYYAGTGRPIKRPRETSIGHRGFAAARNSVCEKGSQCKKPEPLRVVKQIPQTESLSPVNSINDSVSEEAGDKDSPSLLSSPMVMDFPVPPTRNDLPDFPAPPNPNDLPDFPDPPSGHGSTGSTASDASSWQHGRKHQQSSSYGSDGGQTRASTAPSTTTPSMASLRETSRWSATSAGSTASTSGSVAIRSKRLSSFKAMMPSPIEDADAEERSFAVEHNLHVRSMPI